MSDPEKVSWGTAETTHRQRLLEAFRAYLETEAPAAGEVDLGGEASDLYSVHAELAGLKTEVKRESRQVKEALEQFKTLFDSLQGGYETLTRQLEAQRAEAAVREREALRPLLTALLDLHDRLVAGTRTALPPPVQGWGRRKCRDRDGLLASLREGQEMSLRRLLRLLEGQGVRPLEVLGQPLDPHRMRVVEVAERADRSAGEVLEERRRGFLWNEELLRVAEVCVNKTAAATSEQLETNS